MAETSDKAEAQNPFRDDANWGDGDDAPLLSTRSSRPSTPRRATSTRSVNTSPNSQTKSGIVFGTPRKPRRLSNPFADLQTGQHASLETTSPSMPARSLAYPRRVPDESQYSPLENAHAKPLNDQDDLEDEKQELQMLTYQDEEEEAGPDTYVPKEKSASTRSWFSLGKKKPWREPVQTLDPTVMPRRRGLLALIITIFLLLVAIMVLIALNSKPPQVHWKGTLSDSTGLMDSTGFNFTRHIDIGFTNPNLFPMTLSEVEVWAAYQDTHFFGLASNNHVGMNIASLNHRNASLPVEMNFAYITAQDPDDYMLKNLVVECASGTGVNFDLIVHAKVKAGGIFAYTNKFDRLPATMSCDNNMAVLAQAMYVKEEGSLGSS